MARTLPSRSCVIVCCWSGVTVWTLTCMISVCVRSITFVGAITLVGIFLGGFCLITMEWLPLCLGGRLDTGGEVDIVCSVEVY